MANKLDLQFNIFDAKSILNACSKLTNYTNEFQTKCSTYCSRLTSAGYLIASEKTNDAGGRFGGHQMEDYVHFKITHYSRPDICISMLIGYDTEQNVTWKSQGQTYSATLKPLHMLEFGSAGLAVSPSVATKRFAKTAGKGTMSIAGNKSKTEWGKGGNWTAITPTMPMWNAYLTMRTQMYQIAREVFKAE